MGGRGRAWGWDFAIFLKENLNSSLPRQNNKASEGGQMSLNLVAHKRSVTIKLQQNQQKFIHITAKIGLFIYTAQFCGL